MSKPRQLELFGEPPDRRATAPVGPATVPADLEAVARALPREVRLGTSSWSFPGWEGLVYDRAASTAKLARGGLEAYARHPALRAVGIDRTYYAPVPASTLAAYAEVVPDDFRFVVKADSRCTTPFVRGADGRPAGPNDLFLEPAYAAEEVVGPFVEGLGAKGGAIVFQFPPQGQPCTRDPSRFAGALAGFLGGLPPGPTYSVELRDRALFVGDYVEVLASAGATHCLSLHPRMPSVAEQLELAGPVVRGEVVVRWMLRAGLGYERAKERYQPFSRIVDDDPGNRNALAELSLDYARRGSKVTLIVNNKAEGSAPVSIFRVAEAIARRMRE